MEQSETTANPLARLTTEQNQTKLGGNDPDKVLSKCCYFGVDWSTSMAASRGLSLAFDHIGNTCKVHLFHNH
jgi:hypothetical protein